MQSNGKVPSSNSNRRTSILDGCHPEFAKLERLTKMAGKARHALVKDVPELCILSQLFRRSSPFHWGV